MVLKVKEKIQCSSEWLSQYTLKSAVCQQGHLSLQAIILQYMYYYECTVTSLYSGHLWDQLRHLQVIWVQERTGCILKGDT